MTGHFKGKKVLITGAARGIGYCTARDFARGGAVQIITDINEPALKARVEKVSLLNDLAFYLQCIPLAPDVIGTATDLFLGKSAGQHAASAA